MSEAVETGERDDWLFAPSGVARGYIQPHALRELWFHTGTACNLSCPFCLEGSKPGDGRLDRVTLRDLQPWIDEAVEIGVEQFSFTGGEPFIVKDFVNILRYASDRRPCLVLTNGSDAVLKRLHHIDRLLSSTRSISFRVSIDFPDANRHDAGRGEGNYLKAWLALAALHQRGFSVSIARQMEAGEDTPSVETQFRATMREFGLPDALRIVAFPEFSTPGKPLVVPEITEHCMTTYHDSTSRAQFMCAFSKMLIKKNGRMRVYACTLVDDDEDYDQGGQLTASLGKRVMLKHHRCFSCFSQGSSCSEL